MSVRSHSARTDGRGGSALVAALWVIVILSMLVGSFLFNAHVEARITSYYKKRTKADYLARSGIEVATMLMHKSAGDMKEPEAGEDDRWYEPAKRLSDGLAVSGLKDQLGEGTIELDIVPEPARRNVNLLTEQDWERILDLAGLPEEMWPEMIDPFFDWTDADDTPRYDGAETEDYYATLEPPYRAKNGPLDTVGELLLIKGFGRVILEGGTASAGYEGETPLQVRGIEDLLTTYGDGKVNINAASERVLMTLPGVNSNMAATIITEREGWVNSLGKRENASFGGWDDVVSRVAGIDPAVKDFITTDSQIFRVTSVGEVGGVRRKVWCILEHSKKEKRKILAWREED
jgi:general secretion pathway protein K